MNSDDADVLDAAPTEAEVLALITATRLQLAAVLDAMADAAPTEAEVSALLDAAAADAAGYAEATVRPR